MNSNMNDYMKSDERKTYFGFWYFNSKQSKQKVLNDISMNVIIARILFPFPKQMQIYNIAKYENISDRLRRLASSPKPPSQPTDLSSPKQMPSKHLISFTRNQNAANQLTYGLLNQISLSDSTILNQQVEEKIGQKSIALIADRVNLGQISKNRTISRQKQPCNTKFIQSQTQTQFYPREERSTIRRSVQPQQVEEEEKPSLTKIKSQHSFKIDQILTNYNNYRQNKQQFLKTVNKTFNQNQETRNQNVRFSTQNTRNQIVRYSTQQTRNQNVRYSTQQTKIPAKKTFVKEEAFAEIDNIWNQKQEEQDSAPKFVRSNLDKKERLTDHTSILDNQFEQKQQSKPEALGRGKIVFKISEKKKQTEQNQQVLRKKMVLSPRGGRVAGKICKNNDKSFGTLPKHK